MRLVTRMSALLVALSFVVPLTGVQAAPLAAAKSAEISDSTVTLAAARKKAKAKMKMKKKVKRSKRKAKGYKHCGTYKYRKGGKCMDARAKK